MPEWEAPMDGWLTVLVDGERVTEVSVESGEEIELGLRPRDGS